jgi:hypothetical protein
MAEFPNNCMGLLHQWSKNPWAAMYLSSQTKIFTTTISFKEAPMYEVHGSLQHEAQYMCW